MRARAISVIGLVLLGCVIVLSTATVSAGQATEQQAESVREPADYLEFGERLTSDCMIHRARLREIRNTHPSRIIYVELVSYTGKTRSQGSSRFELAPDSDPEPLGCDAASGLERRWEIVDARFAR